LLTNCSFHIIDSKRRETLSPISWYIRQIEILNDAFAGRFNFTLQWHGRQTVEHWAYYQPNYQVMYDNWTMVRDLRKGSYKDLNVFWLSDNATADSFAVYSMPSSGVELHKDACILRQDTLPGYSPPVGTNMNLGKTLIHEVGHWLGLYHPWGLYSSNPQCLYDDAIEDTPRVTGPQWSHEEELEQCYNDGRWDTCPYWPGTDDVTNFMTYTRIVACLDHFTVGQRYKMDDTWRNLRHGR